MPLFTPAVASGITDRVAALVKSVDSVVVPARQAAPPGNMFLRVSVGNDYDVEVDLITPTNTFEQILSGTAIFAGLQQTSTLLGALDSHSQTKGKTSFDGYLNASGLQVSEYFARLWATSRNTQLSAHNVFAERDIVMATVTKSGGVWLFNPGQDLGTGTGSYDKDLPNTGEQFIVAALNSGLTTGSLRINVSGLDDAGHVQQASVSFKTNTSGSEVQVSPSLKYRTITNAQVTNDDGSPNGSAISIFNRRERVVSF